MAQEDSGVNEPGLSSTLGVQESLPGSLSVSPKTVQPGMNVGRAAGPMQPQTPDHGWPAGSLPALS